MSADRLTVDAPVILRALKVDQQFSAGSTATLPDVQDFRALLRRAQPTTITA